MLPIEVMLLSQLISSMLGYNNWYQDACMHAKLLQSCPTLQPHETGGLLCPWDSPGKNTGVRFHALLQGILCVVTIIKFFLINEKTEDSGVK